MTKSEIAGILATIKAAYPMFHRGITEHEANEIIELWHEIFATDDACIVEYTVKMFIATDTTGYPPTIGIIKNRVCKLTQFFGEIFE